jgi:tetratricopeptide (TPR) repeat protein
MRRWFLHIMLCTAFFTKAQSPFTRVREFMQEDNLKPVFQILDSCTKNDFHKDSVLLYRGLAYLKKGDLHEAKKNHKDLIQAYPNFSEADYLNGLIQFTDNNYGKSVNAFNRVIKRDPKHIRALYNRSIVLGLLEDYLSAIEDLDACIALNPDYAKAYYSRAYWYEYTGNYTEAKKDYEQVIRLDPKNYDAYLGLAYIFQNQKENEKACETITRAIKAGSQIAEELKENFCK